MSANEYKAIVVAVAGVPTMTGKVYTAECLQKVARDFKKRAEGRFGMLCGELAVPRLNRASNHPLATAEQRMMDAMTIPLTEVSHDFDPYYEDGKLMANIRLKPTFPNGKLAIEMTGAGEIPQLGLRSILPSGVRPDNITECGPVAIDIIGFMKGNKSE